MRKTLYLHIGARKTGSSALQTVFAKNIDRLADSGIHYPKSKDHLLSLRGETTSGNAHALYPVLATRLSKHGNSSDEAVCEYIRELKEAPGEKILLSGEALLGATTDELARFKKITERFEIDVEVICFVRNLLEHAFSGWLQEVKSGGAVPPWPEFICDYEPQIGIAVQSYSAVFPGLLHLINYDRCRQDLLEPLGAIVGFDFGLRGSDVQVNISLTKREAEVLYYAAQVLRGSGVGQQMIAPIFDRLTRDRAPVLGHQPLKPSLTTEEIEIFRGMHLKALHAINDFLGDYPIQMHPEDLKLEGFRLDPPSDAVRRILTPALDLLAGLFADQASEQLDIRDERTRDLFERDEFGRAIEGSEEAMGLGSARSSTP